MKSYPHELQWLGVVVLTAGQRTASAATPIARASGQPKYASLREPYAPARSSLRARAPLVFLNPRIQKPLFVLVKISTAPGMSPKTPNQSSPGFVF